MKIPLIDIRPDHWAIVRDILHKHVPQHEVWAFGSRAKWTAKEYSDLDLAVITDQPLSWSVSAALADDFSESDLPWKVDVVDWATTSESFRKIIERDKVVVQKAGTANVTNVGRVSASVTRRATGEANEDVGLRDKAANPTYGAMVETLGDLAKQGDITISTGPFGSALHAHDYQPIGVPVIPTEAIEPGRLRHDKVVRISEEKARELARHRLKPGDIVFARRGAQACGLSAPVTEEDGEMIAGTGVITLRILDHQNIDPGFLACAVGAPDSVKWLKHHAIGATMPNLNSSVILSLPIRLPDIQTQRAIAHILGTLDDKIELNRRMNETLEAMARALFKSWFVDFDPVRAKAERRDPGLPKPLADLFPDSFEDSELGEIPKGWGVATLGDVATHPRRGKQPNEIEATTPYIALEHMPKRCIALTDWGTADGLESNKFEFKKGEILFGKLRPYFHKVGVAPLDGVCSTDIVVVTPRTAKWFGFVLGHVSSTAFVDYTNAGSTGTKMPRTSWGEMTRYAVVMPPEAVAEVFTNQICPAVDCIIASIYESRTLAALRDTLLSKLISGELRVSEGAAKLRGYA